MHDLGLLGHEEGNSVSLSLGTALVKDTKVCTREINFDLFGVYACLSCVRISPMIPHLLSYMLRIGERKMQTDGRRDDGMSVQRARET